MSYPPNQHFCNQCASPQASSLEEGGFSSGSGTGHSAELGQEVSNGSRWGNEWV